MRPRRSGLGRIIAVVAVAAVGCSGGFDTGPYTEAVAARFDDGEIMDTVEARCVADGVAESIDWQTISTEGVAPDQLFGDDPLTEQLNPAEIDSLIASIDDCHGAGDIVLQIFAGQGQMDASQLGCFANQMTQRSARDLLRLIIAEDQATFAGGEGDVLLGVCGRGVTG